MTEKKRIIVIDDEKSVRLLTKSILEAEGYEVDTAFDAADAMYKISNTPPDLIVLDIMMPGPDGLQFCRVLKDDEKTSSIPIIMHTMQGSKPYKFKGDISGADGYVVKSDDFSELIKRVKRLLNARSRTHSRES